MITINVKQCAFGQRLKAYNPVHGDTFLDPLTKTVVLISDKREVIFFNSGFICDIDDCTALYIRCDIEITAIQRQ